jgi:hypothetical protein
MPAWVDGALSWIEAAQVDAAMDGGRHVEAFFLNKGEELAGSTKLAGEFFCAHAMHSVCEACCQHTFYGRNLISQEASATTAAGNR